jgi:molybdate transport system substrate-binding protein
MNKLSILAAAAVLAMASNAAALAQTPSAAPQPALRVFATNAIKPVLEELRPQAERAAGRPLAIRFDTSAALKQSAESGDAFDVIILAADSVAALGKAQKLAPDSVTNIARTSVGVGVRSGTAKPDVSTPEAMKRALLTAKGIAYTKEGAAVPYILKMAERLGVADEVKRKTFAEPTTIAAAARVTGGSADLLMTMVSEILPLPGIQLAGPLPADFDRYMIVTAAISTKPANAEAAKAVVHFLTTPATAPVLKSKGMEPPKS